MKKPRTKYRKIKIKHRYVKSLQVGQVGQILVATVKRSRKTYQWVHNE